MFGSKTNVSSASASTFSGLGLFQPENDIAYKKPIIDFSEPLQVVSLVAVVVVGLYAWKRFK